MNTGTCCSVLLVCDCIVYVSHSIMIISISLSHILCQMIRESQFVRMLAEYGR